MKRAISLIMIAVFLLSFLTACTGRTPKTIYTDNYISVSRSGLSLIVTDAQSGQKYTFTLRRIKRNSAAFQTVQTAVDTEDYTIKTALNLVIVSYKDSDKLVVFKMGR